jgi:hypothetical protein
MGKRNTSEIGPLVMLFLVLEGVATLLDVLMGVGGAMSTEESYNAAAAALLACGHDESMWELQYKWFCGGCSAEAMLAAPLFSWFTPSILAWKWFLGWIHIVMVCAGAAIAGRAAGARPAFVFVGLMIAAPGFYRTLALTGFGNHAESTVFPFVSAALLLFARQRTAAIQIVCACAAGIWMGLGIWFTPTALHGFIAVTAVAVWAGRKSILSYLVGLPIGMAPIVAYFNAMPQARVDASAWWATIEVAPFSEMVRWLVSDFVTGQLWSGVHVGISATWWFMLTVVSIIGMGAVFVRKERPWGVRWFLPLLFLGLICAYWLRFDLWDDNPAVHGFDPFNLRYRAPLFPIMALAAAMTSGALDDRSIFRRLAAAIVVVLIAVGFLLRAGSWRAGGEPAHKTSAVSVDGRVDWTVPEGDPPQRLDRAMGRLEDVAAARDFLYAHGDSLPVCRDLHRAELGRRIGLALLREHPIEALGPTLAEAAALPGEDRLALVRGIVATMELQPEPIETWAAVQANVARASPKIAAEVSERIQRRSAAMGASSPPSEH